MTSKDDIPILNCGPGFAKDVTIRWFNSFVVALDRPCNCKAKLTVEALCGLIIGLYLSSKID